MSTHNHNEHEMRQEIKVTLQLTLWLNASWNEQEIERYAKENLINTFADQKNFYHPERLIDIVDIQQEAEIYGLSD
ncbi:hypothetical protein [Mucilaginibacter phyllosphaerae]|uniref:Uncharacterized protein n=1 Tax=Mucilaginibacter phyllosphaerae TaxID=1812349 RepID=A0A4Y8ACY0_9SPHI|nr:hypothetical protein [Mucilaginibacter phyllosphaerae]MBB3969305.1 hypothetical protein [Mucilaginibacter phyllosphaerae]TEW65899.1 hypothetical protein E2R65_12255 [Mucilaginibacter phyllosphaerae]GGH07555.1 hypothetical protein GCM10007352_12390 [Mucilaginibacter phyllosphaerae]